MAETIAATTEEKVLPGKFQQYYQTFLKSLMGDAGFKEQSPAQIKYDVASALRPSYEKARANRIAQTGRNAAMVDTDAASRGMGSSTWVTDAKNRLRNQEAADLANLESDYAGNLYNALLNRLDNQDNKRMALLNTALSTTQGMYDKWLSEDTAATAGGSSGGSGSSRRRSPGKDTGEDPGGFGDNVSGKEYTVTPYTWSYSNDAKLDAKGTAASAAAKAKSAATASHTASYSALAKNAAKQKAQAIIEAYRKKNVK